MNNINFSNELRQLTDALLRVQTQIGTVKQNADNPYFNSKFANLETCWEYLRPFFNKENILIQQLVHETQNGVSVETLFIGYGTQLSGGKLPVPAIKSDPQAYGSAVSYAKRYSLMQACGVASAKEDDDGEKARKAYEKKSSDKAVEKSQDDKSYFEILAPPKDGESAIMDTAVNPKQYFDKLRLFLRNKDGKKADNADEIFKANFETIKLVKFKNKDDEKLDTKFKNLIDFFTKPQDETE